MSFLGEDRIQRYTVGRQKIVRLSIDASEMPEYARKEWQKQTWGRSKTWVDNWIGSTQASYIERIRKGASSEDILECESRMASYLDGIRLPETMGRIRERSVFGATISVPEYLSGSPTCFRRRKHRANDIAPVRVYLSLSASASFSAQAVRDRILGMIALALHLQKFRPVEVYLYASSVEDNTISIMDIRLGLSPIDLSNAVALCGTSATVRGVMFSVLESLFGHRSSLPLIRSESENRSYLQAAPEDIVSGAAVSSFGTGEEPEAYANRLLRESGLIPAD